MDERRQHPRLPVVATIELQDAAKRAVRSGTMRNISLGGAFIEMTDPPANGSGLQVLILRKDDSPISVPGTVVRHADGGIGITWTDLDDDERAEVASLVAAAAPSD